MFKRYISMVFIGLLIFSSDSAFVFGQTKSDDISLNAGKAKAEVLRRGTGEKKQVRVKMENGSKIKGFISQIGEDSFTLTNSKNRRETVIAYNDVKKVEGRGLAGGAKIGIIVGAAVAGTLIVLYIAFQNATRNN